MNFDVRFQNIAIQTGILALLEQHISQYFQTVSLEGCFIALASHSTSFARK